MPQAASWLALAMFAGCAQLPDPQISEDLSALERRYAHPTARIPGELVGRLVRESSGSSELARQLDGLRPLHDALIDAATRLGKQGDAEELDLQGTVDVVHVCPGFEREPASEVDSGGAIHLLLSIEHSRVRRAIRGSAESCRFLVGSGPQQTKVELDAKLSIDLGGDTPLGARLRPELLVRLRSVSVEIDRTRAASVQVHQDQYDFRVSEQRVETRIDMAALGLAPLGSAVLISHRDGSFGVRERRGEWHCDRIQDACQLLR